MPKGVYNGQKPIKLVTTRTPANTKATIAIVPVIVPDKYKIAIRIAIAIRITASEDSKFFFIMIFFNGLYY